MLICARTAADITSRRAPTLREYVEGWLEREVRPNRRATTLRSYQGILSNHVLPTLGAKRVNVIAPADVERCIALIRERASASMAQKARTVLHRALARATALEICARNPVTAVEVPRAEKAPMRFLTAAQLIALFEAAHDDRLEAFVVLLATAGLRSGEALALTWADVDLTTRMVNVSKSAQEAFGAPKIVEPKTAAGRRRFAIGEAAAEALTRRQAAAKAEDLAKPTDLVFPTLIGTVQRKSNLHRRWWRPLLERAGLEHVRLHDLRHSSASLSLLAGTSSKVVADRLGHANAGFTLRVYSHSVDELHRADAAAIDALLRKPSPPVSAAKNEE